MPQIGPLEILVVAVIALIVFGPQRLPDIARSIGKTVADLRRTASEFRSEFESGLTAEDEPEPPAPARSKPPPEQTQER